jgi:hypothetical protein
MSEQNQQFPEHPWVSLEQAQEVEAWMDLQNRELQAALAGRPAHVQSHGQGIALRLTLGGELFLHTNTDGDVLLDVTPEAAWVAPLVFSVTKAEAPRGQVWLLPGHCLIPLILGLNSLISSSWLVTAHAFRLR